MKVPFWKITVAYFIDWVIFSLIAGLINFPMGLILGAVVPDPNALMVVITFFSFLSSLVIFLLYYSVTEYFWNASLGKKVMKLVVAPKVEP